MEDRQFQTRSNSMCFVNEEGSSFRGEQFACRLFKKLQPTREHRGLKTADCTVYRYWIA